MEKPFPAYAGDEPFVFVCYAHDDAGDVYPELRWLQEQGVRLWYDEGISPGAVWRGEIAEAIERCTLILYYLSPAAVRSAHCDREINYALDHERPVLPIYLEPSELPADQRIGLSRVQALHRHKMGADDYREKLIVVLRDDGKPAAVEEPALALRPVVPAARRRIGVWSVVLAAFALAVVGTLVLWLEGDPTTRADPARFAYPMPDKPSLVVLPFANVGGGSIQDPLADGLTDDLITDLSQVPELFVIARNTAFYYQGRDVETRQVAEELGVRYVLEGRIRPLGGDLRRVNAQLIDSATGGTVWAKRFDLPAAEAFAHPGDITREIADALGAGYKPAGRRVAGRSETTNQEAREAFLAGWARYRANTPDDYAAAIPHFERAIALDPDYGRAHAGLAAVYQTSLAMDHGIGLGEWTRSLGLKPQDISIRANDHLAKARLSPSPLSHQVESQRLLFWGKFADAIDEAQRAIALDGNDPSGLEALAAAQILAGNPDAGLAAVDRAMRLDPQNPQDYLFWKGLAQFGARDFDSARATLERARELNPKDDRVLIVLASAYGQLGRNEAKTTIDALNELRTARQEKLERAPPGGVRLGIDMFLPGPYTQSDVDMWQFKLTPDRERLREGLRLAGLPESTPGAESPLAVPGATTVTAAEAKALYDAGVTIVDVRTVTDLGLGYIAGAHHLDLFEAFSEAALLEVLDDKDAEVVIHCDGPKCLRASEACTKAMAWGFSRLYYFRDGFPAWRAAGYPTEVLQD